MSVSKLAILASLALVSAPALAQEGGGGDDRYALSLGTGAISVPSYEGSDSNIIIPEFVIRGRVAGFNFYSRGPVLFFDLIRDDGNPTGIDIGIGPVAGIRLDRTTRIKDAQVRALGKLDTAIELGGFVSISKTGVITSDYDFVTARVAYMRDVADAHDSYVIQPALEYGTPLSTKTFVGATALAEYVGSKYGQYYFNVSPAGSALSGLSTYQAAGSGWKRAGGALFISHALTGDLRKGLTAVAVGGYYKLLGEYERSPIVSEAGDADQFIAGLGLVYSF